MSKAITSKISATSRASIKIKDSFYTVEYSEERLIPQDVDVDLIEERKALWDTCNTEVDSQIEEILQTFNKK